MKQCALAVLTFVAGLSALNQAARADGIWISRTEIMALPTSGEAWIRLKREADSNWGSAALDNNDSRHDVRTLAGAMVAARLNDSAMKAKTMEGLRSATKSKLSRALEAGRGLQSYVIAADIIDYQDAAFKTWVRTVVNANIPGHSGVGLIGTFERSPTNWGGMCRASCAAAALYLKDNALLERVVRSHREFIGVTTTTKLFKYTDTNWHAARANPIGMNRPGSTIGGHVVSGSLPEDMRRGGEFAWPPVKTNYAWEGMQGFTVTAVILHRAGKVNIRAGNDAFKRAFDFLYAINWLPESDDRWQPYIANRYLGTKYAVTADSSPGKGMGYGQWVTGK